MIVTSAYDGYVRLWDLHRAACIKTMVAETGSTSAVSSIKLTPNSKYLYIANMNGNLGLYDLKGNLIKSYFGHTNTEYPLELCTPHLSKLRGGRNVLMTGSEDGRLVGWDINS